MKLLLPFAVACLLLIVGCTGSKDVVLLDKNSTLTFENPYWQEIFPGQEDGQKSMVLFLPYSLAQENYNVDSVYFKGYHAPLKTSTMGETKVYRAQIMVDDNKEAVKPPYEINADQALVTYINGEGQRRYFIVENVIQGESIYMP